MMDSFELNKIAGGVLLALLLIFVPKTLINELSHHGPVTGGFTLPQPDGDGAAPADGGAPVAGPKAFDPADVVALVGDASPDDGKAAFRACAACHSADKGAASKAGPNLYGVLGRALGSVGDFGGYSDVIKSKGGEWSYEALAEFLHAPRGYLPGTRMVFNGVSDNATLADLIAYLRSLADSPAPLPAPAAAAPAEDAPAAVPETPAAPAP
ncbi:cytochrome C [Hyphomicrobium nitrativorans NL23]|uniref:Cytochrome C n=1 Tax=Hyphomicrobium nitrativorans NL23 TaxID=1029756 RepID=V5SCZ6_9HYPH|nr:c-type cytochrome [Hyphomicrobium nitrativorans]AHB47930.1 cytochrome C [Hyphomicrobium nitrativorans NL23]